MRKDVDRILADKGFDGMFLYSESFKAVSMYYLTRFLAPDPFVFIKRVDEKPIMVINSMEHARAQKESAVKDVRSYNDYNMFEIMKSTPDPKLGLLKFIATIAKKELGDESKIYIPPDFPAIFADALRSEGLTAVSNFDVIEKARETKEPDEVAEIKAVQSIVEAATTEIIAVIAEAEVDPEKTLTVREDGKQIPLTVHKIKSFLGHKFLDRNCVIEEEIIVACGPKGADPHYFGNPPDVIKANQPLILDIYPRNLHRRYCTDMTRTIVKGRASMEVRHMFEAVLEAKDASIDSIKAGATGSEINDICCDSLEKAGYATPRGGKRVIKGLTHSLGHGLGLQVHESPRLSEFYPFPLESHNVVTVEPGLYNPEIGGVRIEDLVEITNAGCNNLTTMKIELEL